MKSDYAEKSIREILASPIDALVGVDADDVAALTHLDIETVHDLATAPTFNLARRIRMAAEGDNSPMASYGLTPASATASGEPTPVEDLVDADISALAGVTEQFDDDIRDAIALRTIRDFSQWPPYLAARAILGHLNGVTTDEDSSEQTPAELVPVARQYNTEKVFYEKVFLDEVLESTTQEEEDAENTVDRPILAPSKYKRIQYGNDLFSRTTKRRTRSDGGTASVGASESGGFPITIDASTTPDSYTSPALGAFLTFSQSWYPEGLSLGNLLHSTSLAPGEMTRIAVLDWARQIGVSTDERIDQAEQLDASTGRTRAIDETQDATAREFTTGSSQVRSDAISSQSSASGGLGFSGGGFSIGASGSGSKARTRSASRSVSSSSGRRDLSASMSQRLTDITQQQASSTRSRRASIVSEISQEESVEAKTRVVTNYNHMHSLNLHYYEVVQIYRTEVRPEEAEPIIFLPFEPIEFDKRMIRRYRGALLDAALDNETYRSLANAFGKSIVTLQSDIWPDAIADEESEARAYARIGVIGSLEDGTWDVPSDATLTRLTSMSGGQNDKVVDEVQIYRRSTNDPLQLDVQNGSTPVPEGVDFADIKRIAVSFDETAEETDDDQFNLTLGISFEGNQETIPIRGLWTAQSSAEFNPVLFVDQPIEFNELVSTLNESQLYYSRVVWEHLDQETLSLLLRDMPLFGTNRTAELVEPTPVATYGNLVGFRLSLPEPIPLEALSASTREEISRAVETDLDGIDIEDAPIEYGFDGFDAESRDHQTLLTMVNWWGNWRDRNYDAASVKDELVSMPSDGVHMEPILGRANAAEKLDITRFWDWQESPIPFQATAINPVDTGSRASDEQLTPGSLDSPIVNIQTPPSVPDPAGLSAILNAVSTANLFRDMSGLDQTAAVAQQGQQSTSDAATSATKTTMAGATAQSKLASQNYQAKLKADTERMKTLASLVGASTGGSSGSDRTTDTNSGFGALLNEADKQSTTTSPMTNGGAENSSDTSNVGIGDTGSSSGSSSNGSAVNGSSHEYRSRESDSTDLPVDMLQSKADPVGRATDAMYRLDSMSDDSGVVPAQYPSGTSDDDVDLTRLRANGLYWKDQIVSAAKAEERAWTKQDTSKKDEDTQLSKLESYYGVVAEAGDGVITEQGAKDYAKEAKNDESAWSAAFISYVVNQAGVSHADGFAFHFRHLNYVVNALVNRMNGDRERPFWLFSAAEITPEVGDILCKNRKGKNKPCSDHSLQSLAQNYTAIGDVTGKHVPKDEIYGRSHCDIVVEKKTIDGNDYIETVGGNTIDLSGVADTVGRKRWKVDSNGRVEYRVDKNNSKVDGCSVFGYIRIMVPSIDEVLREEGSTLA
ncbi:DUF2272 domain-containing protein [Haladaptatus sp. YSMS36]|uniref:DUF2272 domain-containing protein n=1 Tax=Haladaptatus sp. YSMS36 TaxID=3033384 RepID=UPI0023E817FB|nr:DUF2272 domain-containing protein [Haladaptatus sp. YSMS36]